jgi:HJR/Mrr/RecB family endonuclease
MQAPQREFWDVAVVTRNDVDRAQSESLRARASFNDVQNRLMAIVRREEQLAKQIRLAEFIKYMRKVLDDSTTRVGGLTILILTPSASSLVFSHLLGLPLLYSTIPLLAVLSITSLLGVRLFKPDDVKLGSEIDAWHRELHSLQQQKHNKNIILWNASAAFKKADGTYQALLREFESRLNRLRCTDWRALQGIPFENFLVDVFREWGYQVETTKTSGDQGVDLILSRASVRIAIQAKGYVSSTVGNSAVQEAHTGMKFYQCQRCAVITNSTFTSSARQLAAAVGCALIDGSMIPNLIEGQIRL